MTYRVNDKNITAIRHKSATITKALLAGSTVFAVAAAATPTISFVAGTGTGYAGTVYRVANGGTGNWQRDGQNIAGQSATDFQMVLAEEGRAIRWMRSDGVASAPVEMWVPSDKAGLVEHTDLRNPAFYTTDANNQLVELRNIVNNAPRASSSPSRLFDMPVLAENNIVAVKGNGTTVLRGDIVFNAPQILSAMVGRFDTLVSAERLLSVSLSGTDDWSGVNRAALISRWGGRTQIRAERNSSAITALPINDNNLSLMVTRFTSTQGQFYIDDRVSAITSYSNLGNINPTLIGYLGQPRDIDRSQGLFQGALIYNSVMTTDDIANIRGYMAHVYKLTHRLASNDPFKTVAPRIQ